MATWQTDWVEPRSTSSHWGSEKALDQRVVRLPSVALEAGQLGPCNDDAVVGWCSARFVVPQVAEAALTALMVDADRNAAATLSAAMTMPGPRQRERRRERGSVRVRRVMGVLSRERDSGRHRGAGSAATAASSTASDATILRQIRIHLNLSCNLTGLKLPVKTHLLRVFSPPEG